MIDVPDAIHNIIYVQYYLWGFSVQQISGKAAWFKKFAWLISAIISVLAQ